MWSSLYACPLCTEDDYEAVLGPCVGGFQTKNYVPKSYPNRCVGMKLFENFTNVKPFSNVVMLEDY